jgi:hypothetical protein
MGWFNATEGLAIWLEAIALILIFIWDRFDSHADHKQTIAQMKIAQEQAAASQAMTQSTINSERAWVLGSLGGDTTGSTHVVEGTSTTHGEHSISTSARIMLTYKNEGRTPAWVDNIYADMEIVAKRADVAGPDARKGVRIFGTMGPLGAGRSGMRVLDLTCLGHRKEDEALSIYVLIQYRDIFNITRETHLGYILFDSHNISQLDLPERNQNT